MDVIVNVVAGVVAIAAGGWAFVHWHKRPKFVVGVTPTQDDKIPISEVGRPSVTRQFVHKSRCFARRFRDGETLSRRQKNKLLADPLRRRTIKLDADSVAQVPVLLANHGKREANVALSIHLLPGRVHLVNVETEALETWIYAHEPRRLRMTNGAAEKPTIVADSIRKAYDAYMTVGDTHGDLVYASGTLEAGLFELAVLTVQCEADVDAAFLLFTVNCSDGWLGTKTYIQACRLERSVMVDPEAPRQ